MAYVTITAILTGKAKRNGRANDINFHLQHTHNWISRLFLGEKWVVSDCGVEPYVDKGRGERHLMRTLKPHGE